MQKRTSDVCVPLEVLTLRAAHRSCLHSSDTVQVCTVRPKDSSADESPYGGGVENLCHYLPFSSFRDGYFLSDLKSFTVLRAAFSIY